MKTADSRAGPVLLGIGLIVVGLAFLVLQQLELDVGQYAWPLFVIAPGVLLAAFGLALPRGSGVVVAGTITTMVGLILLYQNTSGHWESWAYAWALAAPTGPGLGLMLYGAVRGEPRLVNEGMYPLGIGLALFAGGFVFFEQLIGISGRRLPIPDWLVPAGLVLLGAIFLLRGVAGLRRRAQPKAEPEPSPTPPSPASPPDEESERPS